MEGGFARKEVSFPLYQTKENVHLLVATYLSALFILVNNFANFPLFLVSFHVPSTDIGIYACAYTLLYFSLHSVSMPVQQQQNSTDIDLYLYTELVMFLCNYPPHIGLL